MGIKENKMETAIMGLYRVWGLAFRVQFLVGFRV